MTLHYDCLALHVFVITRNHNGESIVAAVDGIATTGHCDLVDDTDEGSVIIWPEQIYELFDKHVANKTDELYFADGNSNWVAVEEGAFDVTNTPVLFIAGM